MDKTKIEILKDNLSDLVNKLSAVASTACCIEMAVGNVVVPSRVAGDKTVKELTILQNKAVDEASGIIEQIRHQLKHLVSDIYVQHHSWDEYSGSSLLDDLYGPFASREEALQFIKDWDYTDEYDDTCYPNVDEVKGTGFFNDGYYNHILQIV